MVLSIRLKLLYGEISSPNVFWSEPFKGLSNAFKNTIKRPFNGLQNSLQGPLKGKGLFKTFSNLSKGRLLVTCERSKGLVKPVGWEAFRRPLQDLCKAFRGLVNTWHPRDSIKREIRLVCPHASQPKSTGNRGPPRCTTDDFASVALKSRASHENLARNQRNDLANFLQPNRNHTKIEAPCKAQMKFSC